MEGVVPVVTRDEKKLVCVVELMETNFMYFVAGRTYLVWGQIMLFYFTEAPSWTEGIAPSGGQGLGCR